MFSPLTTADHVHLRVLSPLVRFLSQDPRAVLSGNKGMFRCMCGCTLPTTQAHHQDEPVKCLQTLYDTFLEQLKATDDRFMSIFLLEVVHLSVGFFFFFFCLLQILSGISHCAQILVALTKGMKKSREVALLFFEALYHSDTLGNYHLPPRSCTFM
jgi:hypothetical protein